MVTTGRHRQPKTVPHQLSLGQSKSRNAVACDQFDIHVCLDILCIWYHNSNYDFKIHKADIVDIAVTASHQLLLVATTLLLHVAAGLVQW